MLVTAAAGVVAVVEESRDEARATGGHSFEAKTPVAEPARPDPEPKQPTAERAQPRSADTERQAPTAPSGPPDGARRADARSMVHAELSVPETGLRGLTVVPYRGSPDDGPGTRIQNGGVAATPIGRTGGTGPGQVGNYIITAHRTTSPAPFADLPALRAGDHVLVRTLGRVFDYRVTDTRWTSFRSRASLRRQAADVPGRPGVAAKRAMITLSTCATPEDHARGNYWSDQFGNPEHRIDKIGVLVGVRDARSSRADDTGGA
jgi:sortase A